MRVRESALFAAYTSVILYGLIVLPSLLNAHRVGPRMDYFMLPLTFLPVFATAAAYTRKRPLDRPSRGAVLGAWSAVSIYGTFVLGIVGAFLLAATYDGANAQPAQMARGIGWYGLILSPVLLPGPMLVGAFAGMFYIWAKRRLGLGDAMQARQPMNRGRRWVFVIALIAAPVLFLPGFFFLSGVPGMMMFARFLPN